MKYETRNMNSDQIKQKCEHFCDFIDWLHLGFNDGSFKFSNISLYINVPFTWGRERMKEETI